MAPANSLAHRVHSILISTGAVHIAKSQKEMMSLIETGRYFTFLERDEALSLTQRYCLTRWLPSSVEMPPAVGTIILPKNSSFTRPLNDAIRASYAHIEGITAKYLQRSGASARVACRALDEAEARSNAPGGDVHVASIGTQTAVGVLAVWVVGVLMALICLLLECADKCCACQL